MTSRRKAAYLADVQKSALAGARAKTAAAKTTKSRSTSTSRSTTTTSSSSSSRGAKKREVKLPSAKSLTATTVTDLLFHSRATRASLKALFKQGLALHGVKRGQIPVLHLAENGDVAENTREETRMLSRCSADELGAYLAHLLRSSSPSKAKGR